jgi:hypothetical protein
MNLRRPTLVRAKRNLLVAGALLCFAAAGVLTPSDVRSQLDVRRHDPVVEPVARPEAPLAAILPDGDAFAPRAEADDTVPASPPPRLPVLPRSAAPLSAAPASPRTRVTAIATGRDPSAIVEQNGSVRAVTIGDALDGSTVTAIEDDRIALANGRHLSLEPLDPQP